MSPAPAGVRPSGYVLAGKLSPPYRDASVLVRPRVISAFSATARVTLVIAPLGFGKTIAVEQWLATGDNRVAWISLDLLDHDATTFWAHVITAITATDPMFDDEPLLLLHERGPRDPTFLGALISQITAAPGAMMLVLDGLDGQLDRTTIEQLGVLVERTDRALRLAVTTRVDDNFAPARWRSLGWVADVDADTLRLTDDEAIDLATTCAAERPPNELRALNAHVGGWPLALHLTLTFGGLDDGASPPQAIASSLIGDVLDTMPEPERELARALCVLDHFDPEFCTAFVGANAGALLHNMLERGVLLEVSDPDTGTMRFHSYFRTLLKGELRRHDPARRLELHRRAARLWLERGDLLSAFSHLDTIGEADRARALFVDPAMAFVEQGDRDGLRRFVRRLPAPQTVGSAQLAADLSFVALFSDGPGTAARWCDRADAIRAERGAEGTDELGIRLRGLRCAIALLEADLDTALATIDEIESLGSPDGPVGQWFHVLAARVLLGARRIDDARAWIAQAERVASPGIVREVTVPTLRAWHEWAAGDVRTAAGIIDAALGWMDTNDVGTHHLAFDTLITAAWVRLAMGDIDGAERLADRARHDAELLASPWNQLQAAFLAARCAVVTGRPDAAIQIVDDARSLVSFDRCRSYTDRLLGVEIEALIATGRTAQAQPLIDQLQPGPRTQLLAARLQRSSTRSAIERTLVGWGEFPSLERLQAELLIAAAEPESGASSRVARVVERCHEEGWVLPLVGMGARADRLIGALNLDRIHPELADTLKRLRARRPVDDLEQRTIGLTAREHTLLELLPTHLSYTEIGDRLLLSVNTVKSNLRSVYRKLGATTRAEAVDHARRHGLI